MPFELWPLKEIILQCNPLFFPLYLHVPGALRFNKLVLFSFRTMPKSKLKPEVVLSTVGTITNDIEVPTASEIVFKHTWCIKKYNRSISKQEKFDSPPIRCSVNNLLTLWNLSVRFWKGANGKRIKNPIVLCLNLTSCTTDEPGQVKIRFQLGVWDAKIKHWECCPVSRIALNLDNSQELLSVGYRDLSIRKDHVDSGELDYFKIRHNSSYCPISELT